MDRKIECPSCNSTDCYKVREQKLICGNTQDVILEYLSEKKDLITVEA